MSRESASSMLEQQNGIERNLELYCRIYISIYLSVCIQQLRVASGGFFRH